MDDKLRRTLAAPDFESWRARLWREISNQAITEDYVQDYELRSASALDALIQDSRRAASATGDRSSGSRSTFAARSSNASNNSRSDSNSRRERAGGQIGRPLREVLARQGQRYRLSVSAGGGRDVFDVDAGYYDEDAEDSDEEMVIDFDAPRWSSLFHRLVEIRYLFRAPVSRCVHARFLHAPPPAAFGGGGGGGAASGFGVGMGMGYARAERVDVGCLSFHTNPHPSAEEKRLFESRKRELLEWRQGGGVPPRDREGVVVRRSPKVGR